MGPLPPFSWPILLGMENNQIIIWSDKMAWKLNHPETPFQISRSIPALSPVRFMVQVQTLWHGGVGAGLGV